MLKTLYISRPVKNTEDIVNWAKSQGFERMSEPSSLHVTICYSRSKLDWNNIPDSFDQIRLKALTTPKLEKLYPRSVMKLGKAIVLQVNNPDLQRRWEELRELGASWDYDEYIQHITIYFDEDDEVDYESMTPYLGQIDLGPEEYTEIDADHDQKDIELTEQLSVINELFDAAQPYIWKKGYTTWDACFSVTTKGKTFNYELSFVTYHDESKVAIYLEMMNFKEHGLGGGFGVSSTGAGPKLYATVIKIIKEYVEEHPNINSYKITGQGEAQSKMYELIFNRLSNDFSNWKVEKDSNEVYLNKKIIDESNLYSLQPDGTWKKNADRRSPPKTKKQLNAMGVKPSKIEEAFNINQINADKAYEIFKKSYEAETGASWSKDKFLSRAYAWTFYGDDNGYVSVRKQASGMKKLVGMAGDPRSCLKGLDELAREGGPIWGAVSDKLAKIAAKRGMIVPHLIPGGPTIIRAIVKLIPSSVFGGYEPKINRDGGMTIAYDDVGNAEKYLIGNKAYFQEMMKNPRIADIITKLPMADFFVSKLMENTIQEKVEMIGHVKVIRNPTQNEMYDMLDRGDVRGLIFDRDVFIWPAMDANATHIQMMHNMGIPMQYYKNRFYISYPDSFDFKDSWSGNDYDQEDVFGVMIVFPKGERSQFDNNRNIQYMMRGRQKAPSPMMEGYSKSQLQSWASEHERNIYDDNDPLGGSAEEWNWKFYPSFPISKLTDLMNGGIDGWKNWMKAEITNNIHDYGENYYDSMMNGQKIKEPILVVENNGKFGIWDGWHRVASSFMIGRETLPAIIGTRKN